MVFAVILQWIFFHSLPSALSVIGSLMIISSAMYVVVCFPSQFLLSNCLLCMHLVKETGEGTSKYGHRDLAEPQHSQFGGRVWHEREMRRLERR